MSAASMTQSEVSSRVAVWWVLGVVVASVGLIALDRVTGPFIRVSIGFVLPVAIVAYRWNWPAGLGLGLLLGVSRLLLVLGSDTPWLVASEVVNLGLSLLIFGAVAAAARQLARARNAAAEGGRSLPVCGGCGRVRDAAGRWVRFERFVTSVAAATFSHTVCPECESRFGGAGSPRSPSPN